MTLDVVPYELGDLVPAAAGAVVLADPRTLPPPGLYPDVPHDVYLDWEAASATRLKELRRTPAHLRAALEDPIDKRDFLIGRAAHTAVLEPQLFESRYVRGPEGDRRTKAVQKAWDDLAERFPGAILLKPADYDLALEIRAAVHAHDEAACLLSEAVHTECSATWVDRATGVRCKARADALLTKARILDLKSTADASEEGFARSIHDFGYAIQAPFYLDGFAEVGFETEEFVFVAVEKTRPYAVAVYRLGERTIEHGRQRTRELLQTYAWCQRERVWPGYPGGIRVIDQPEWAFRRN